jgi:predicted ABC-class ATPase
LGSLTIITGSPGAGKTTLASRLAKASPRGAHIPGDLFYTFLAHPIHPVLPASQQQNTAVIAATAHAAGILASADYDVFMDGIFGPWFLPVIARELTEVRAQVSYVVLTATLDEALRRAGARDERLEKSVVRQMHAAFTNLGEYRNHALDVTSLTPDEVEVEFRRIRSGLLLDLGALLRADTEPEMDQLTK